MRNQREVTEELTTNQGGRMRDPRKVPTTTKKCGYTLDLIERTANCAIYRKTKSGIDEPSFEVHRIRKAKNNSKEGAMIEVVAGDERLATSEEFGRYGWQYDNLRDAVARADSVDWDIANNKEA